MTPLSLTLETVLRVPDSVATRELEGESIVLDLESGMYFGLDVVGTRIWQLVVEHGRLASVRQHMLDEYDVEPPELEADLLRLAVELVERRLLVISGPNA